MFHSNGPNTDPTPRFVSTPERRNKNINVNKYSFPRVGIEPTISPLYSQTLKIWQKFCKTYFLRNIASLSSARRAQHVADPSFIRVNLRCFFKHILHILYFMQYFNCIYRHCFIITYYLRSKIIFIKWKLYHRSFGATTTYLYFLIYYRRGNQNL